MTRTLSSRPPVWTFTGDRALAPVPFLIAGILNCTPDSFSDGGSYQDETAALARVRQMHAEGAGMIDLGGESTRPGAPDIGAGEEIRRLSAILPGLLRFRDTLDKAANAGEIPSGGLQNTHLAASGRSASFRKVTEKNPLVLSVAVDTYRAETAAWALQAGADVINDVSGGGFDPEILDVLGQFKPGYVLGHSPTSPAQMLRPIRYTDVVEDLLRYFETGLSRLVKAGLPESRVCLDPCIGFGKSPQDCLRLIARADRLQALGRPLYYGVSRKSFLGTFTGYPVSERDMHTQVITAYLASKGVQVHRVHDVKAARATLELVTKLESA